MGEEFYAAIKLISGEEVFSLISIDENDGDPIIILQNPVIMKMSNNHLGSYIKVKPWMETCSDDFFVIKLDKIITMTEVTDETMISIYTHYISDDDSETADSTGKVKISDKMGYISSVEDARNKLENLFKDNKNT